MFKTDKKTKKGFTLIELLVVISIISLLSSVVLASLSIARAKARDAKRLSDMHQIQLALELYRDAYGNYPVSDYDGSGGWDIGNATYPFISRVENGHSLSEFMPAGVPRDMAKSGAYDGYLYFRYTNFCVGGIFYVLGVIDMEGTTGAWPSKYPTSPGWSCGGNDWQFNAEWVMGRYEN